jgi:hypothetical protein
VHRRRRRDKRVGDRDCRCAASADGSDLGQPDVGGLWRKLDGDLVEHERDLVHRLRRLVRSSGYRRLGEHRRADREPHVHAHLQRSGWLGVPIRYRGSQFPSCSYRNDLCQSCDQFAGVRTVYAAMVKHECDVLYGIGHRLLRHPDLVWKSPHVRYGAQRADHRAEPEVYTLTCAGAGGSASASVVVSIDPTDPCLGCWEY